jgi:hypothetical protein
MAEFNPNARTAPTAITTSMRGPESQNTARVVVDMEDQILLYQPEATPLMTLTAKMRKKRKAVNPRFDWLEKDEYPRGITLSAAVDQDDTSLTAASATEAVYAVAGNVLVNTRTGENVLVTTTPTTTAIVVTRGIGGGNADMDIGDTLLIAFNSQEDGAGLADERSIQEFNYFNFTQIIRTPFGFTGRDLQTELYGGRDEMTETKWQAIEHKKSIEYALAFGKRHTMTGTHQRTFTNGLDNAILTNRWNVEGVSLTERSFVEFLEVAMKWGKGGNQNGSGTKYLLASSAWLTEINGWVGDRLRYKTLDKSIGFEAQVFNSPHGNVNIIRWPLLDYFHPDKAFLLDLNHIRYVYMRGRDTKLLYDRQGNDIDGKTNEYFSDVGAQIDFEHSHSALFGLGA